MRDVAGRAVNAVMFLLFLLAVAVQYNDPDPLRWMTVYGLAALGCLLAIFGRLPRAGAALLAAAALVWALLLAPRVVGRQSLNSEEGREMMGLLIVVFWMTLLFFRARPREASTGSSL
jgi:hypothetical protein